MKRRKAKGGEAQKPAKRRAGSVKRPGMAAVAAGAEEALTYAPPARQMPVWVAGVA